MKRQSINDPAYWLERAEEARRMAEHCADSFVKQTMLDIARHNDNLAALTETRPASRCAALPASETSDS
jgi:hypothetical protein